MTPSPKTRTRTPIASSSYPGTASTWSVCVPALPHELATVFLAIDTHARETTLDLIGESILGSCSLSGVLIESSALQAASV